MDPIPEIPQEMLRQAMREKLLKAILRPIQKQPVPYMPTDAVRG